MSGASLRSIIGGGGDLNRALAGILLGTLVIVGLVLALTSLRGGDQASLAAPLATSTSALASSTTATPQGTAPGVTGISDPGACLVVDIRVTANGPLDGIGLRFNPEFEVTASFLESGGDAILHVNTGYQDEATDQWVTYSWLDGASIPTPEEAAIPNGTYDPASQGLTGTETLHYLLNYEDVPGGPIAAPFTATYDPTVLSVVGSIGLSDGQHSFTLAAQRNDLLDGPGCVVGPEAP